MPKFISRLAGDRPSEFGVPPLKNNPDPDPVEPPSAHRAAMIYFPDPEDDSCQRI